MKNQKRKMSSSETQAIIYALADIASSGHSMNAGLRMLSEQASPLSPIFTPTIRRQFQELAEKLESGLSLDQALRLQGAPEDLVTTALIGIQTGNLGQTLTKYLTDIRFYSSLKKQILVGLTYPFFLIMFQAGLLLFIFAYVVPTFSWFESGSSWKDDDERFSILIYLLPVGYFVQQNFYLISSFLVIIALLFVFAVMSPLSKKMSLLTSWIPLIGFMCKSLSLSKFANTLAFLVENKVTLPDALRLAGESTPDYQIARASYAWADCAEVGEPLSGAVSRIEGIPAEFFEPALLEKDPVYFVHALRSVGELYELRVKSAAATLVASAEPLITLVVGSVFIFLIMSLLWELVNSINEHFWYFL